MASLPVTPYNPQPPLNPVQAYGQVLSLRNLLNQGQMQQEQVRGAQLENQQRQMDIDDQQKWRKVFSDPTIDWTTTDGVRQGMAQAAQAGVSPKSMMQWRSSLVDYGSKVAQMDETRQKIEQQKNDQYRGRLLSIINQQDPAQKQQMWDDELTKEEQAGGIPPGQMSHQYPGDDAATVMANHFALGSVLAKEAIDRTSANARQLGAQTGQDRLNLEKPGILADNTIKQANAGVAPQMAQLNVQGKQTEISKNQAETNKANIEAQNLGQQPIFAVDPSTNERVMTTRPEAQAKGYTNPVAVKEGDVSKETDARAMINDVQLNKSRYLAAMQRVYSEPMTTSQKNALVALTPEKLGMDFGSLFKLELPDVVQKVTNASSFSALSPAQKQAVIGYYSTLASVPAAQKALTNIGRSNKEMMDLELRTIPTPLMDQGSFSAMLDRFQGNIDQTSRKTVRMPGMPSTQDIRTLYEGQQRQQPKQTGPQFMDIPKVIQPNSLSDLLNTGGQQ